MAPRILAVIMGVGVFAFAALGPGPADSQQSSPGQGKAGKAGKAARPPSTPRIRLTDRLLQELEVKRRDLSRREKEIRREETRLNELRSDIKKRIATLQNIEKRIQQALDKVESASDERLDHLVKAYSAMGPDEAATLMNAMKIELAVRILRNMQVKKAGIILAVVQPRRAARISEMLVRAKIRKKKK